MTPVRGSRSVGAEHVEHGLDHEDHGGGAGGDDVKGATGGGCLLDCEEGQQDNCRYAAEGQNQAQLLGDDAEYQVSVGRADAL